MGPATPRCKCTHDILLSGPINIGRNIPSKTATVPYLDGIFIAVSLYDSSCSENQGYIGEPGSANTLTAQ